MKHEEIKQTFMLFSPPVLPQKLHECACTHPYTRWTDTVPPPQNYPGEAKPPSEMIGQRGIVFLQRHTHYLPPPVTTHLEPQEREPPSFPLGLDPICTPHPPRTSLHRGPTDQDSRTDRQLHLSGEDTFQTPHAPTRSQPRAPAGPRGIPALWAPPRASRSRPSRSTISAPG